eukprot:gb/GECH01005605.1/.p1 GENE.gb/GECH01005605.1/~~gb/GECH01005605.1/.p1  ORF type:complete len:252 (+),score=68.42 gb/GECH01005605.1/:1-756(+)
MDSQNVTNIPECYVMIHHISKRKNIGRLVRSCVAFNVKQILLVGGGSQKKTKFHNKFALFGNKGSSDHMNFKYFGNVSEAVHWLKERNIAIVGVEIGESAQPIQNHPFTGSTCFILGNEGTGMTSKEIEICDYFVYIPQYGKGTASLNVTVAGSIILHHFAVWAGYQQQSISGQKYDVEEIGTREERYLHRSEEDRHWEEELRQERAQRREEANVLSSSSSMIDNENSGDESGGIINHLFELNDNNNDDTN